MRNSPFASADQCNAYDSAKGAIAPGFHLRGRRRRSRRCGRGDHAHRAEGTEAATSQSTTPKITPLVGPNVAGMSAGFEF